MNLQELKALRYDPISLPLTYPEEYFNMLGICWDIGLIRSYLDVNPLPEKSLGVDSLKGLIGFLGVDPEYAMSTSREEPVILAEIFPGQPMLIDGAHRGYKAIQEGRSTYPALLLPFELQLRFLVDQESFSRLKKSAESHVVTSS